MPEHMPAEQRWQRLSFRGAAKRGVVIFSDRTPGRLVHYVRPKDLR
jgi:bifunctional ADP-heptose synthase (sugar kinase/adenylyltransferase)